MHKEIVRQLMELEHDLWNTSIKSEYYRWKRADYDCCIAAEERGESDDREWWDPITEFGDFVRPFAKTVIEQGSSYVGCSKNIQFIRSIGLGHNARFEMWWTRWHHDFPLLVLHLALYESIRVLAIESLEARSAEGDNASAC